MQDKATNWSQHIKNLAVALLFLVLTAVAIRVYFTARHTQALITRIDTYITADVLRDLHNDVTTTASSGQMTANAYSEIAKSTVAVLDNDVPKTLRGVNAVSASLAATADELRRQTKQNGDGVAELTRNMDREINTKLLPETTSLLRGLNATATKFGLTADETSQAIKLASDKVGVSLDTMNTLIADPAWRRTLENLEKTTGEFAVTSHNVAEASKQAPSIAASLEKIATTSSRFTKITLISNIIATLARAFLP